jgi:hypothetical protein
MYNLREFKRDGVPLFLFFPLSLIGEGDKGGEVDIYKKPV